MSCPVCESPTLSVVVPEDLREYAPERSEIVEFCTVCLRTHAGGSEESAAPVDAADAEFSHVLESFPSGRAGVAFALLLGKLDSLALERAAIETLYAETEEAGGDPMLTLDRIAAAGSVQPHFDIDRRRPQLAQFVDD
ncbi:hypothetical protein AUR64_05780 [Haloprofundus marisrubri]|uniref:Uncharacterized protein n=1 Tax=Haloprofundus marisrubri TaxID=1514971 RepID=A0A0W1RBD0_9EURY|nr:DUF6276 family protein [Haloprofundus marisrubri]KTG10705.1 hypothetical protein AUR64_05780 [Haloprofundus marisrubri]